MFKKTRRLAVLTGSPDNVGNVVLDRSHLPSLSTDRSAGGTSLAGS
jgi:hypothetical protein